MTEKQILRIADLSGSAAATACLICSFEYVAGEGYLWPFLFGMGIFIFTNKINRIIRSNHD